MRKLLLIGLFLPVFGFGQNLSFTVECKTLAVYVSTEPNSNKRFTDCSSVIYFDKRFIQFDDICLNSKFSMTYESIYIIDKGDNWFYTNNEIGSVWFFPELGEVKFADKIHPSKWHHYAKCTLSK